MRVVVTSTGADLDQPCSPIFGRCPMFLFIETESMEFEAVANPAVDAPGGAGIEAAQFVVQGGVAAVITGRIGPKAMSVLEAAGIAFHPFDGGTVREATESFFEAERLRPEPDDRAQEKRTVRIAFAAADNRGLDSVVSHHFGRCPHYVLVDLEGDEVRRVEMVDNPFHGHHEPGEVPRFIRDQGVGVMVSGGMGRRALAFFEEQGIEPVTGAEGRVAEALEGYLRGAFGDARPCRESVQHGHRHEHDESGRTGRRR
jgi:predicted Fe-Mo cluster-binding NifX family protein